jgi:hypothetical protein
MRAEADAWAGRGLPATVKEIVPQLGPRDCHLLPREERADGGNRRDGKSLQP